MTNIVPVQFKAVVNDSAVDTLEKALDYAKSGEIVSVKLVGTTANGEVRVMYSSTNNAILELAAIARLMHQMQINIDEASD